MGDTGSTTLGLTVSFLVLSYTVGDPSELQPSGNLLVAFSVVLVPLLDVLRVVLLRLIKRKPLFLPDNNHIHHHLLRLGFSKQTVLYIILSIALGFVVFNMWFVKFVANDQTILLLLDITLWFTVIWLIGVFKPKQLKVAPQESIEQTEQNED